MATSAPAKKRSPRRRVQPRRPPRGALRAKKNSLPQTVRSDTAEAMEKRLETLDPGTPRYELLSTAIDFKRSWLLLAERLSQVVKAGEFKEWGYRSLDAYARRELHMRRETCDKLLRSYGFLESHEKPSLEAARGGEPMPLPNYQALDVLAEARENPDLPDRDYRELRDQVFENDPSASRVRKMLRERTPQESQVDPQAHLRKCLALAERLYGFLLEDETIPERVPRSVETLVGDLRHILGE